MWKVFGVSFETCARFPKCFSLLSLWRTRLLACTRWQHCRIKLSGRLFFCRVSHSFEVAAGFLCLEAGVPVHVNVDYDGQSCLCVCSLLACACLRAVRVVCILAPIFVRVQSQLSVQRRKCKTCAGRQTLSMVWRSGTSCHCVLDSFRIC